MSENTMAEVLIDHQRQNSNSCLCGWSKLGHSHPEHVAAALTAAGFGLVADAKAEAWDEGRTCGARYPFGKRGLATDDNPYRRRL